MKECYGFFLFRTKDQRHSNKNANTNLHIIMKGIKYISKMNHNKPFRCKWRLYLLFRLGCTSHKHSKIFIWRLFSFSDALFQSRAGTWVELPKFRKLDAKRPHTEESKVPDCEKQRSLAWFLPTTVRGKCISYKG
jgi:hypothetical protein